MAAAGADPDASCCVADGMRHKRPLLVAVSMTVHLVVVLGLFVAGFWKIDRLDPPRRRIDLAVAPPPPPAPSGSSSPGEHEPFKPKTKKLERVVVREITQPEVKPVEATPTTSSKPPGDGTGGHGSGSGSGSGTDPNGTGECVGDHCGTAATHDTKPKDEDAEAKLPATVIPQVIKGMRVSGETQIQAPANERLALARSGKPRATATVKVCVSTTGSIMSLGMFRASGLPGWDAAILAAVRKWGYKPHRIDNRAVAVCGMVTFVYEIR